jgi:hypothetical protein
MVPTLIFSFSSLRKEDHTFTRDAECSGIVDSGKRHLPAWLHISICSCNFCSDLSIVHCRTHVHKDTQGIKYYPEWFITSDGRRTTCLVDVVAFPAADSDTRQLRLRACMHSFRHLFLPLPSFSWFFLAAAYDDITLYSFLS